MYFLETLEIKSLCDFNSYFTHRKKLKILFLWIINALLGLKTVLVLPINGTMIKYLTFENLRENSLLFAL